MKLKQGTIETMFGDEYTFSVIGTGWGSIHTSNTTITFLFDRPTPSQWGNWWS